MESKPLRFCSYGNTYSESKIDSANLTGAELVEYVQELKIKDPFLGHVDVTVETPKVPASGEHGDVNAKGWHRIGNIPVMIDGFLKGLAGEEGLEPDEVKANFLMLKESFKQLVSGAVLENKHEELFAKTQEVMKSYEKHATGPDYYSEMLDIMGMANAGLNQIRLNNFVGSEYEKLQFHRDSLLESGKTDEYAQISKRLDGLKSGRVKPEDDRESSILKTVSQMESLSEEIQSLKSSVDRVDSKSLGEVIENSREILPHQVGAVGKGEGLAFSDIKDVGIAVAFISKDTGRKAGVFYTSALSKDSLKFAAKEAAKGSERGTRDLRAVIIGGDKWSEKNDGLIASALEFCRENEITLNAASILKEEVPKSFVICDDEVVQGKASFENLGANAYRVLAALDLIPLGVGNVAFTSLDEKEKPFPFFPNLEIGANGYNSLNLLGIYNKLVATGRLYEHLSQPPQITEEVLKEIEAEGLEIPECLMSGRDILLLSAHFDEARAAIFQQLSALRDSCVKTVDNKWKIADAIQDNPNVNLMELLNSKGPAMGESREPVGSLVAKKPEDKKPVDAKLKLMTPNGIRTINRQPAIDALLKDIAENPPAVFIGGNAFDANSSCSAETIIGNRGVREAFRVKPGEGGKGYVVVLKPETKRAITSAVAQELKANSSEPDKLKELSREVSQSSGRSL